MTITSSRLYVIAVAYTHLLAADRYLFDFRSEIRGQIYGTYQRGANDNLVTNRQLLENRQINNVTREGVDELMEYLKDDLPHLTIEQAKFKQSLGINDWDPLPEGVDYPEEIRTAAE